MMFFMCFAKCCKHMFFLLSSLMFFVEIVDDYCCKLIFSMMFLRDFPNVQTHVLFLLSSLVLFVEIVGDFCCD